MAKYNRPNGKLFGSSATNIGVFGSGQQNETPATSTDPNTVNGLGTHWEEGWDGAVVSQAPYTAPYIEDMNAVNYVNSYNSAYLLQRGIPEYSATEEYQEDSVCTYNGEIWICLQDNTVGQTPAEGVYWHLQGEVPIMNDNEILVGAVGGTPTVVDTNAQGDILASASGLDIKANTIINADVNASAGIVESKLALDYATSTLNSDIGTVSGDLTTHTSNTSNPHSVTKAQVLSGDPIVNADVDASAGIEESKLALDYSTSGLNTAITTHTGDTANPHSTKISNLGDVVLTTPINDKDVINWDSVSQKFVNSAPLGGALSTLSDVTLTSPTDKQLVQYDYANSKWVNSSAVWDRIEVNDVANINTATTDITLTTSDKRHQVFTATNGFTVTLPSTGIKAGESFLFGYSNSWWATYTNQFNFNAADNTRVFADFTEFWDTKVIALVDNPATSTDWAVVRILSRPYTGNGQKANQSFTLNASGQATPNTGLLGYLPRCTLEFSYHIDFGINSPTYGAQIFIFKRDASNNYGYIDGEYVGSNYGYNVPLTTTSDGMGVTSKTGIMKLNTSGILQFPVYCYMSFQGAANTSNAVSVRYTATAIAPL